MIGAVINIGAVMDRGNIIDMGAVLGRRYYFDFFS
jgi:tetrahydrodipicolinate N-succinyltransferase